MRECLVNVLARVAEAESALEQRRQHLCSFREFNPCYFYAAWRKQGLAEMGYEE